MGVMISGPSDVVDDGTGEADGKVEADDGVSVGVGGGWTASDVDVDGLFVGVGGGWTASDVDIEDSACEEEEEDGCADVSGGGATNEEDDGACAELPGTLGKVLGVAEEDTTGDPGVGITTSDVDADAPAIVDDVSATLDKVEIAELEEAADELDMLGSGSAEELGTPTTSVVGIGVGRTVV
jgi:hypothetical protein